MDSIVLASKSQRRREILRQVSIPFIVEEVDIDEYYTPGSWIIHNIIAISRNKVGSVLPHYENGLIVGVDTVVYFQGMVIGKPRDENEAKRILRLLSGNRHWVISGITVADARSEKLLSRTCTTSVIFNRISNKEQLDYIQSREWIDKAGGYAIQGKAAMYITRIEGSYTNVVGLPVETLYNLLKKYSYFESNGLYRPIRRF